MQILENADNLTDKVLSHLWCTLPQSRDYVMTISKNLKYQTPSLQSIIQQKRDSKYSLYEQQILERKQRKQEQQKEAERIKMEEEAIMED